jgi:hypothetical protein
VSIRLRRPGSGSTLAASNHRNHPGPQHHRIAKRLDAKRMFGHAWNSEIVRFRPKSQNEVIKRQLSGKHPDPVGDRHSPSRKVDRFDFPTQNGYMPKQLAKRIADVRRLEVSSCHLVKHRRKESEVIPADEVTSTSARFAAVRSRYRAVSTPANPPPKITICVFLVLPLISCTIFKHLKSLNIVCCNSVNQRILGFCSSRQMMLKSSTKIL